MAKKQFYGIKYPFTIDNDENYYTDVNYTLKDKARSIIMHIIFTPKGQKLRDPDFGTNLIRYIFEPSDSITWSDVKTEVSECIEKYLTNVTINNIEVMKNEEEISEIFVRIDYTVSNGINSMSDSIVTQL